MNNDWDKEQMNEPSGWDAYDIVSAVCAITMVGMFILLAMEAI